MFGVEWVVCLSGKGSKVEVLFFRIVGKSGHRKLKSIGCWPSQLILAHLFFCLINLKNSLPPYCTEEAGDLRKLLCISGRKLFVNSPCTSFDGEQEKMWFYVPLYHYLPSL